MPVCAGWPADHLILKKRFNLLTVSLAASQKNPPQKNWLNINETVLETMVLARWEVVKNYISLRTPLSDDVPLVRADRIQLRQIILNLIVNAIEAISVLRGHEIC